MSTSVSFESLGLPEELIRGIYARGYNDPSPIQQKSIPHIGDKDVIIQAPSGNGKTAAFGIGILKNIDMNKVGPKIGPQAIILAPTRKLAEQISNEIKCLGTYLKSDKNKTERKSGFRRKTDNGLKISISIGKRNLRENIRELENGVHIVIGTPGRVHDMIYNRKKLITKNVRILCLDEADEMLDFGFLDCVEEIYMNISDATKENSSTFNTLLFSATLNKKVLELTESFMNNPYKHILPKEDVTLKGILQYYIPFYDVTEKTYRRRRRNRKEIEEINQNKFDCLMDIFKCCSLGKLIIFTNQNKTADWLYNKFMKNELMAEAVTINHSNMDDDLKNKNYDDFLKDKKRILISSDINARGIDIQKIELVINFEIPKNKDVYVHRIGRSGRFGRKGKSLSLIGGTNEMRLLNNIKDYYKCEISSFNIEDL